MAILEYVAHEQTGLTVTVCNLGCRHKMMMLRRLDLAVVELRNVPDLWAAAHGQPHRYGTGARAVDQFGVEWFRDWDGLRTDGFGGARLWETVDGRLAWQAKPDGSPSQAKDGYVIE